MKHRIAAVGGTLRIGRSSEGGTEITALVPRTARSASAAGKIVELLTK
jgi:signal transduction histidine kinase